jgi:homoaconitase/3-isopropylmalate dehydratase large subunit
LALETLECGCSPWVIPAKNRRQQTTIAVTFAPRNFAGNAGNARAELFR